jgi:hypothetical protein
MHFTDQRVMARASMLQCPKHRTSGSDEFIFSALRALVGIHHGVNEEDLPDG